MSQTFLRVNFNYGTHCAQIQTRDCKELPVQPVWMDTCSTLMFTACKVLRMSGAIKMQLGVTELHRSSRNKRVGFQPRNVLLEGLQLLFLSLQQSDC